MPKRTSPIQYALLTGIATTGVLAIAAIAKGAPQVRGKTAVQSSAGKSHLVTGPRGSMNQAIAAGATAIITLQPVAPKTQPPSDYPLGSSIVGQTLFLGSVPSRLWIEILVTGWAPETLRIAQVAISATDPEMDGGGYMGTAADCSGEPPVGAGNLMPAMQACSPGAAGDIDCRNTMSGLAGSCAIAEPSRCVDWNGSVPGNYFFGRFCRPGFQDRCDARWLGNGISYSALVDISTFDFRYGIVAGSGEIPTDFTPSYLGTLVVDAPFNARGAYTIDAYEFQTFLQNPDTPKNNNIPIAEIRPAVIDTPCEYLDLRSKPRFVSFFTGGFGPNTTALRVKLLSLHHVSPPYAGGPSVPFTQFEGEQRWVGPPHQYFESTSISETAFYASALQCTPYYDDWELYGLLHVTGSAIVPSSMYEVVAFSATCQGNEVTCTDVSAPLSISTTRWGDVETPFNPPSTTTQPDLGDVAALVNKFKGVPGAPIKARALLVGDDVFGNISPSTLSLDFGFGHIAACVDAFKGKPYPHTIEACP